MYLFSYLRLEGQCIEHMQPPRERRERWKKKENKPLFIHLFSYLMLQALLRSPMSEVLDFFAFDRLGC